MPPTATSDDYLIYVDHAGIRMGRDVTVTPTPGGLRLASPHSPAVAEIGAEARVGVAGHIVCVLDEVVRLTGVQPLPARHEEPPTLIFDGGRL